MKDYVGGLGSETDVVVGFLLTIIELSPIAIMKKYRNISFFACM